MRHRHSGSGHHSGPSPWTVLGLVLASSSTHDPHTGRRSTDGARRAYRRTLRRPVLTGTIHARCGYRGHPSYIHEHEYTAPVSPPVVAPRGHDAVLGSRPAHTVGTALSVRPPSSHSRASHAPHALAELPRAHAGPRPPIVHMPRGLAPHLRPSAHARPVDPAPSTIAVRAIGLPRCNVMRCNVM